MSPREGLTPEAQSAVQAVEITALQAEVAALRSTVTEIVRDRDRGRGMWMLAVGCGALLVGISGFWDHLINIFKMH